MSTSGLTVRGQGQLGEALIEFQKAYAINPGSAIALQELQETQRMICASASAWSRPARKRRRKFAR